MYTAATAERTPVSTILSIVSIFFVLFLLFMPALVEASGTCACRDSGGTRRWSRCLPGSSECDTACTSEFSGGAATFTPGDTSGACAAGGRGETTRSLENPLRFNSIEGAVGGATRIFTGISGSVALLMFVYGGVLMMTSGGNQERVAKGKKVLIWATLGLAFIFMAYGILNTLFTAIGAN